MARKTISEDALDRVANLDWRGNVRELRNTVERLVILSPGNSVDISFLDSGQAGGRGEFEDIVNLGGTFQGFKERAEAAFIKRQLELHKWNISKTAEALDIQRSHLYTKMKRYGLTNPSEAGDEGEGQ
jgi:DNA-binding NtrC family response regulator